MRLILVLGLALLLLVGCATLQVQKPGDVFDEIRAIALKEGIKGKTDIISYRETEGVIYIISLDKERNWIIIQAQTHVVECYLLLDTFLEEGLESI